MIELESTKRQTRRADDKHCKIVYIGDGSRSKVKGWKHIVLILTQTDILPI